jgi:hypothetical protein
MTMLRAGDAKLRAKDGSRKQYTRPSGASSTRGRPGRSWRAAAAYGVALTWYEATRHMFVSRFIKAGVALGEVSAAVGHSTPMVTKRHYAHFVRKTFSAGLRMGLAG